MEATILPRARERPGAGSRSETAPKEGPCAGKIVADSPVGGARRALPFRAAGQTRAADAPRADKSVGR